MEHDLCPQVVYNDINNNNKKEHNGLFFKLRECFIFRHVLRPPEACHVRLKKVCFLCFVDRASRYNRVKKNQLDAQLILSIFRQPLHVSGVSRPIIRRYNHMYTAIGTYYSF